MKKRKGGEHKAFEVFLNLGGTAGVSSQTCRSHQGLYFLGLEGEFYGSEKVKKYKKKKRKKNQRGSWGGEGNFSSINVKRGPKKQGYTLSAL